MNFISLKKKSKKEKHFLGDFSVQLNLRTAALKDHKSRLWKYYLRARRLGEDFRGWRGYCRGRWRPEENPKEHKPVYSPSWKPPTGPHPQCSQSEKMTRQWHWLCCVDLLPNPTLLGSLAEGPQLPCKDAMGWLWWWQLREPYSGWRRHPKGGICLFWDSPFHSPSNIYIHSWHFSPLCSLRHSSPGQEQSPLSGLCPWLLLFFLQGPEDLLTNKSETLLSCLNPSVISIALKIMSNSSTWSRSHPSPLCSLYSSHNGF